MSDIKFIELNHDIDNFDKLTYNDIEFTSSNDIAMVTGSDYIKQSVTKVLKTNKVSDVPFPNYGTQLSHIRSNYTGNPVVESLVSEDIVGAIAYIRSLEASSLPSEQIAGISNISLASNTSNLANSSIKVTLSIVANNGQTVTSDNQ